jgi:hypothetical protein
MPKVSTSKKRSEQCELVELLQYHCVLKPNAYASCKPIERVFRKCAGRPMVEVTHVVEYDEVKGKNFLPSHLRTAMPPAHHWSELNK